MNVLLVYATNSGGTETAVNTVADILGKAAHQTTVKHVTQATPEDFTAFDCVVLASPSWDFENKEGQPHEDFFPFMEKLKDKTFEGKKFAVLGLGDSSYTIFCGAVGHLEELVKNLKGTLVIPSLKIDKFYYEQEKNTQLINAWAEELTKTLS
jgi:flavodoxin